MNAIPRSLMAALALAAAAPMGAWASSPDFEWYMSAGRPQVSAAEYPAPRAGFIWAPGRYEWTGGTRQVYRPGAWIVDDYDIQWRYYAFGNKIVLANGPLELRDRDGNVIPINADASHWHRGSEWFDQ